MDDIINNIKNKCGQSDDIIVRKVKIKNSEIAIVFNEVLGNGVNINDFILKNISKLSLNEEDK